MRSNTMNTIDVVNGHDVAVYDYGDSVADRYTIALLSEQQPDGTYLCLSVDGQGGRFFSQWGECLLDCVGARITFCSLPLLTQAHFAKRLLES
jgi:hypothetical protein